MGCMTDTPTCAPSTPVTMGNREPPIWAKTKTKEMAVALIFAGKTAAPTEMALGGWSAWVLSGTWNPDAGRCARGQRGEARLTVANSGPEKKPNKLMATEAAMMFGTLQESVCHARTARAGWRRGTTHSQKSS